MNEYLCTFTPGHRPPHSFRADTDKRAERMARGWRDFSELFRRTDRGWVLVAGT